MGLLKVAPNINDTYSLGKDKKTKEWMVGQWANQSLWTVDGTNRRIGSFKDMTGFRYFHESMEYTSEVELSPGDRVLITSEEGKDEWFYVICATRIKDAGFNYVVGI